MTDTCPRCLRREIHPAAACHRGADQVAAYRCPCGHTWATSRQTSAYDAGVPEEEAA